MAEYVEKQALEEKLELLARYEDKFTANVILGVAETIRLTKPVDVAPVVHGHWIEKRAPVGIRYFECSRCGAHENIHTAIKGRYCWGCGAKMDGGDNDAKSM